MTVSSFGMSSRSLPWYLIGCATAIPELFLLGKCSEIFRLNMWIFSLRVPCLIPLALLAHAASTFLAERREIATRATFLGIMTGLGLDLAFHANPSYKGFGLYVAFLGWFHFSEYYFTERYNPKRVQLSSFMIYHSRSYVLALLGSVFEFFLERYIFPGIKMVPILIVLGCAMCLFGDGVRKRAMYVAGPNFNHIVQYDLSKEPHDLVTSDVYSYVQHPSYIGWFIFTIGTQVILANPVCGLGFSCVMYRFFEGRVKDEEPALAKKYKETYERYKNKTPRFIPYLW